MYNTTTPKIDLFCIHCGSIAAKNQPHDSSSRVICMANRCLQKGFPRDVQEEFPHLTATEEAA
jgi:hypothetical protein